MNHLIVFNYAMDTESQVFAHQLQVVEKLSKHFEQIQVFTSALGKSPNLNGVRVSNVFWVEGQNLRNTWRLYKKVVPYLVRHPNSVLFSHMTEVQSALIAPLTKALKIPHFLWYAHTSNSRYLSFASRRVTAVISSTHGSCPIKGPNVRIIGQGVNHTQFTFRERNYSKNSKLVHVGRIDPSKNIDSLISTTLRLRREFPELTLTIIGESTSKNYKYFDSLQDKYSEFIKEGCVVFKGKIHREALNLELSKYDAFLHDFDGSLDKTLVEAALVGLPVVTSNKEFICNFLTFGLDKKSESLEGILRDFLNSPASHVKNIVGQNREIAVEKHSLENWILALVELLKMRNRLA